MALSKLYKYDTGHIFTIKTETGLTAVNTATINFTRPNDVSSGSWVASVFNASSGTLVYVTQSGDLDTSGTWEAQAFVWESGSKSFHGETFNFEVFDLWA